MKTAHTKLMLTSVFTLVLLLMCNTASAQGTANGLASSHDLVLDNSFPVAFIGDAVNPIPIDLDLLGAPWIKEIYDPNGLLLTSGGIVGFVETIINAGTEPWYDWHEQILPDLAGNSGGNWVGIVPPHAQVKVNGNPISVSVSGIFTSNLDLTNFSQPVLPGDVMTITKLASIPSNTQNFPGGPVMTLHEYPTPEPASAALMGIGSLLLIARRRAATN